MQREANFSTKLKDVLAKRCGYHCSNPKCKIITIGAHSDLDKAVSIGWACHIEAAMEGGPRYNKNMSLEERKSIRNGIWLCAKCAAMIDADEKKYSVDLLHNWKLKAEEEYFVAENLVKNNIEPRIISVANPAGGVGKSFVSGAFSIALTRVTGKKVLCVSAAQLDHAPLILGLQDAREETDNLKEVLFENSDVMELKVYHTPLQVDVVFSSTLERSSLQQHLRFGRTDFVKVFNIMAKKYGYGYIVCDCGRGDSSNIQKEILLSSSDVVIPLGEHIFSNHGIESICNMLRYSNYCKNIWTLYSIGYLTSNPKLNEGLRRDFLNAKEVSLSLSNITSREIKTVIPKNRYVEECLWKKKDIFAYSKTKNVAQAYENVVKEILDYSVDDWSLY